MMTVCDIQKRDIESMIGAQVRSHTFRHLLDNVDINNNFPFDEAKQTIAILKILYNTPTYTPSHVLALFFQILFYENIYLFK